MASLHRVTDMLRIYQSIYELTIPGFCFHIHALNSVYNGHWQNTDDLQKSSAKQWVLTMLLKVVYEIHADFLILVKGIHQLVQL